MTWMEIKNLLSMLENPADKLELVMDIGARADAVPDGATCYEVSGCTSVAEICVMDGKFYGRAASAIVRGVLTILLAIVDGKDASQRRNMDIYKEFSSLNLPLGAGRLNGVNSMIRFLQNL